MKRILLKRKTRERNYTPNYRQAIINHAETASKLAKAIYQIADILPQQSLLLILYPTKAMQESVARLYAYILQFFLDALTWYRNRRAVHAIKAIFQPWDLSFRKHFEAIAAESLQIGRLADTAAKAELRDTRLQVMQGARHCEDAKLEIQRLRQDNERLASIFEARIGYVDNFMHSKYWAPCFMYCPRSCPFCSLLSPSRELLLTDPGKK